MKRIDDKYFYFVLITFITGAIVYFSQQHQALKYNCYMSSEGKLIDLKNERALYFKRGIPIWIPIQNSSTANVQIALLGDVFFTDDDYVYISAFANINEVKKRLKKGDSAVDIVKKLKDAKAYILEEEVAKEDVFEINAKERRLDVGQIAIDVLNGYTNWQEVLQYLIDGVPEEEIARKIELSKILGGRYKSHEQNAKLIKKQ